MVWWTSPAKEVLNVLFNRILAPYVENLDMNQVNYGIGQGQLTLRNLQLKRGALDKFRLPVDVIEGHLGKFTLSLHWMNLGNQPVEVFVEDVYLLVVPSPQNATDPEEDERRMQSAKAERVESAELLHMRGQAETTEDNSQQSQGLVASLIAKIVNNLQVTVKNIHVRYEDKMSVPGHPFAAGLTLAGFTAASVNNEWKPTFIESTAGKIHKLGKLESLAVYFDTDTESLEGLSHQEFIRRFESLIAHEDNHPDHQFIVKPITGEGRIVMNHRLDKNTPRFDVNLTFDEIGVALDDNQYRDVISLVDMFHFYARQHQYKKFRPPEEDLQSNRPRALLAFAQKAILADIHDRHRRWTWAYFAERRDDRNMYVELFKKKLLNQLAGGNLQDFDDLEKKLSYEDIRFYRSIARSQLRKDLASRRKLEEEKQKQPAAGGGGGWTGWIWGSSQAQSQQEQDPLFRGTMTEQQRKELYQALDIDDVDEIAAALQGPRDALQARVHAELNKGSFALKTDPHGKSKEIISVVFDAFKADVIQRVENLETSVSLGGFRVYDGTTESTLYNQIVHVKEQNLSDASDPFFFLKFEKNPLDERADSALAVRLRHMEIIYHKGYAEAVYKFFKPPASQLESVEALLDVASQTLEGIRRDTRAGLEYALQTHKTIDIQMDLNAPIIIIPEDITTNQCKHLVVDAGHISIESELADKNSIREVQLKRTQKYTEEDYHRLESLMYDRFSLKLEAAQFVLGNDLESCRKALTSTERDSLHLVERINLDLDVQNSIVPKALNLARFKVAGKLPSLQVNFSDTKYKTLMRLIDVAIPKFDDEETSVPALPPIAPVMQRGVSSGFASGLFGNAGQHYEVDTESDSEDEDSHEQFFDLNEDDGKALELHQHQFEFNFSVDQLIVAISRSTGEGSEKPLADVSLNDFALAFALAKFDMKVDIDLQSLSMDVVQSGKEPVRFVSSADSDGAQDTGLLGVKYKRVQRASPEFHSVYEGIDQSVDIKVSTFIFRAAPEPVVALYDFIMTTFVPQSDQATSAGAQAPAVPASQDASAQTASQEKIRVLVSLASVQVILINEAVRIATLSLSTAQLTLLLHSNTMNITGRLGSMALSDDSELATAVPEFKQIMTIEGDDFADFRYQTYSPSAPDNEAKINSKVWFKAASIKVHVLEQPLHAIYLFVVKLANLKGLYDAAASAAAQRASEIQRMVFDISVKSPIVVFPAEPSKSSDVLVLRLGEIGAQNSYEGLVSKMNASLRGIQLISHMHHDGAEGSLKMIDDIDISSDIIQTAGIDRSQQPDYPETQVSVTISDVKLHLTQLQYRWLLALMQALPRILAAESDGTSQAIQSAESSSLVPTTPRNIVSPGSTSEDAVNLQPELQKASATAPETWTTVDLVVTLNTVKLHLYDGDVRSDSDLKTHGIARFALNQSTLRLKMLNNGAMEAQVVLHSFVMSNTRPGNSKFREIIPAAKHDRNQFMVLYTSSGGAENSSLAVVTIDSPQVIFAVDPIFALLNFFTAGVDFGQASDDVAVEQLGAPQPQTSRMDFRVDLHDVSVSILKDDTVSDSQAMVLSVHQLLLSQQGVLALNMERLGMSLTRMGKPSESVRFLDELDATLTLDTRALSGQQMTSIEISVKPIIFRASYRDIDLIMAIVNRAIALYAESTQGQATTSAAVDSSAPANKRRKSGPSGITSRTVPGSPALDGKAQVLMTKEQLKGSFDGFRLVLIGDLHEQPLLHLRVKPFILGAKDWSGELHATTTLAIHLGYWNLTNSHWEPLLDPWTFTAAVSKESATSGMAVSLSARDRLDLNVSTTSVELVLSMLNTWSKEGEEVLQRARGSYAPYRVCNLTGSPIHVWSDLDGSHEATDTSAVRINHDQTIDWRFDDWKTMREHVSSSGQNHVGLQFIGKPWERLRSIPVDRAGEYVFALRPRMEKYTDRLMCEVKVQDNVKIVTFRSTYKVENQTLYPVELTLIDESGHPVYSVEKIAPGQEYALPIEAVVQNRIRLQPDQGFGYKWSPAIRWEDLLSKKSFTIKCAHADEREAGFRFHASVQTDLNDPVARKYPKMNLRLRAPIELENLLPYNLEYRIYDKDTDQNWRSYLRKGGVMPVHSVELGHLVLLNVTVQDTSFKPSDFAIINTAGHSDFDIEKRLTVRDARDRKLDLRLNYVRPPDTGGSFKVQIYSPYLVVNKTGLPFAVRSRSSRSLQPQDVAGDNRPEVTSTSVPMMVSSLSDRGHEFTFRTGDSSWSKLLSFEAPSAETRLIMASQSQKSDEIHVGLAWAEGLGKYKLTKVITLRPRFVLKNNLADTICFREHGVAPRERSSLNAGENAPLHFIRSTREKLLTLAYPGLNAEWSAPFNIEDIGAVHLQLKKPEHPDVQLVRADVQIDGSSIFISFNDEANGWPFVIENGSDYPMTFCQTDSRADADKSGKPNRAYSIAAHSSANYAWDYPAAREKKIMLVINDGHRAVDIMEIGDLVPFRFHDRQTPRAVSLDVRADGHKQILSITNYSAEHSLYKPRRRSTGSLARSDTMSSSQEAFEAVTEEITPTLTINIAFAGIGLSLMNRKLVEVVYLSVNTLAFEYTSSDVAQAVTLTCGTVQIDNQLHDAMFPVVLQPSPVSKESSGVAALPTVQASFIWLNDEEHGVFFIKYCSILLQALTIEADEDFLFSVYELSQISGVWDDAQEDVLIKEVDDTSEPAQTPRGQDLYFEVLELQPIKVSISFMVTGRLSSDAKLSTRNPLAVVLNALTMTLGNINDASLEMNALAIKDMRLTAPDLQERIMYHYRQEVLRQIYRILGSADFIGNPVGLFTNVSSGVADIFYEPINGLVMHGNKELGIGIAKGAASFVKKTVFGVTDSMTKFTSSVGKGLSAATMDSEYQLRRRMNQRRNKPRHAIYGVTAGAEALATSVASGMEGVLMKPIEGAESGGAFGFFKGVGKGLVGAVTKPVVGVFDLAANVTEGIRNTTTVFDNPERDRVRLPRHVPSDGVLVPFSEREALGQFWMRDLDHGAYRKELYVAHINIPGGDNVILLTTSRVLSFWSKRLRLEWELPFTSVQGVTIEDTGIRFAHKAGKDHDKFIYIPDKSSQSWFFSQVATVVKTFNVRRRMDA